MPSTYFRYNWVRGQTEGDRQFKTGDSRQLEIATFLSVPSTGHWGFLIIMGWHHNAGCRTAIRKHMRTTRPLPCLSRFLLRLVTSGWTHAMWPLTGPSNTLSPTEKASPSDSPGSGFWGTQVGLRLEAQKSGCSSQPAPLANNPALLREKTTGKTVQLRCFCSVYLHGPQRYLQESRSRDTNSKWWNCFLNNATLHRSSYPVGRWPFQKDRFLFLLRTI